MLQALRAMQDDEPIEHKFIRDAILVDIEVTETKIEPTFGNEDWRVHIVMKADDELLEMTAFALIYALGALSFHDGRPRGFSGFHFEEEDEWTASDMLKSLTFRNGHISFYADYVRGRCMKTTIKLAPDGTLTLETINRGQAATRWVSRLQGEKTLRVVGAD